MPIYEYQCSDCGNEFEKLVRRLSQEIACPSCQSTGVEKLMSTAAFKSTSRSSGGHAHEHSHGGSGCGGCSASSCAGCK